VAEWESSCGRQCRPHESPRACRRRSRKDHRGPLHSRPRL